MVDGTLYYPMRTRKVLHIGNTEQSCSVNAVELLVNSKQLYGRTGKIGGDEGTRPPLFRLRGAAQEQSPHIAYNTSTLHVARSACG